MKFPKRLKLDRSCFYQLPDTISPRDLVGYELEFRKQYPGIFHSCIGPIFFFELPKPRARDAFLTSLEYSLQQEGVQTERLTLYPD